MVATVLAAAPAAAFEEATLVLSAVPDTIDCVDSDGDESATRTPDYLDLEEYDCSVTAGGNPVADGTMVALKNVGPNNVLSGNESGADDWTSTIDGVAEFDIWAYDAEPGVASLCFWVPSDGQVDYDAGDPDHGGGCSEEVDDPTPTGDLYDVTSIAWEEPVLVADLDCVDSTGDDTETNPAGIGEEYTCTVTDDLGDPLEGVSVAAEIEGVNDTGEPDGPGELEFLYADHYSNPTDDDGEASFFFGATEGEIGTSDICFWIDTNNDGIFTTGGASGNNGQACDEESAGNEATDPQTDVAELTWVDLDYSIDCTPEAATTSIGSFRTFTCEVKDGATPVQGVTIVGENLDGANDPDSDEFADPTATDVGEGESTDADGKVRVRVRDDFGFEETGPSDICFWVDEENDFTHDPDGSDTDGSECDEELLQSDEDTTNNADIVSLNWVDLPTDLSISKSGPQDPVVGQNFNYTLLVTNEGPNPAYGVEIADPLPPFLQVIGIDGPDAGTAFDDVCANQEGELTCVVEELATGASATFTVTVKRLKPYDLANWAFVDYINDTDAQNDSDDHFIAGDPAAMSHLVLAKTTIPAVPDPNSTFTYRLELANTGPAAALDVSIDDSLPEEVEYVSHTSSPANKCTEELGEVSCAMAELSNGQSLLVDIVVTRTSPYLIVNSAEAFAENATSASELEKDHVLPIHPSVATNFSISKAASSETPGMDEAFTYTVTVKNEGPHAGPFEMNDLLPVDTEYSGPITPVDSRCEFDFGDYLCEVASLASGQETSFVIPVTRRHLGAITNRATVWSPADTNDEDDDAHHTLPVHPSVATDLRVDKVASEEHPDLNEQFNYTVTVTNIGPNALAGDSVFDFLPDEVEFVSASPGCVYEEGTHDVECAFTNLAVGEGAARSFTITVRRISKADFFNIASISSPYDTNMDNDDALEETDVHPSVVTDLSVTKTAPQDPAIGAPFEYTVTVMNHSTTNTASDTTVRDDLPKGLTYVDDPNDQCVYNSSSRVVTCTVAQLAPGGVANLAIDVVRTTGGSSTNCASLSNAFESGIEPNSDCHHLPPHPSVITSLEIRKLGPDLGQPGVGGAVNYTIEVENTGQNPATDVVVTDFLPDELSYVSASEGCEQSSMSLWVVCDVGTIPVGQTEEIAISVTRTSPYNIVNEAGVSSPVAVDNGDDHASHRLFATDDVAADLDLEKTASDPNPGLSEAFTYTFEVTNNGPNGVDNAYVDDTLSEGLTFVGMDGPDAGTVQDNDCEYDAEDRYFSCETGPLTDGGSVEINLFVTRATEASIFNEAAVLTDLELDPNDTNDLSSVFLTEIGQVATIVLHPDDPSKVKNPRFTFTRDGGTGFECSLEGAEGTPSASEEELHGFTACNSNNEKIYVNLRDGEYTFLVRAMDGSNAGAPDRWHWFIDTGTPTVTLGGTPSAGARVKARAADLTFSSNEAGTFQCKLESTNGDFALHGFQACGGVAQTPANTQRNRQYSELDDGTYTFTVKAIDAATNESVTASRSWIVDNLAPTTTLDANVGPTADSHRADRSAEFTFRSNEAGTFECRLDGPVGETLAQGTFSPCGTANANTAVQLNVGNDGDGYEDLDDGVYTFSVKAIDGSQPNGNTGNVVTRSWTVDTVSPTTTLDANVGPAAGSRQKSRDANFTYQSNEAGTFQCKLEGPNGETSVHDFSLCGNASANTPVQLNIGGDGDGYEGLDDGIYTFRVVAFDRTGVNQGNIAIRFFTVDNTSPTTTLNTAVGPAAGGRQKSRDANFTYQSNEAGTFECKLEGPNGETSVHGFASCGGANANTAVQLNIGNDGDGYEGLDDGTYTFSVKAIDLSQPDGNTGNVVTRTWTVDNAAPTTTLNPAVGPPADSTQKTRSAAFTYSSSEAGVFMCKLQKIGAPAATFQSCGSSNAPAAPVDLDPSYSNLTDGQYTFTVKAIDLVGNEGNEVSRSWTIDATVPTTEMRGGLSLPAALVPSLAAIKVDWLTGDNVGVTTETVEFRTAKFNAKLPATWSPWTKPKNSNLAIDKGSTYCFRVTAQDAAGNSTTSPEKCVVFPVDSAQLQHPANGWTKATNKDGYFQKTFSKATKKDKTLTLNNVQATDLYLYATKCKGCGSVEVQWKGKVLKTIDLNANSRALTRFSLASFSELTTGNLVLKTKADKPVEIDAVGVNGA